MNTIKGKRYSRKDTFSKKNLKEHTLEGLGDFVSWTEILLEVRELRCMSFSGDPAFFPFVTLKNVKLLLSWLL